MDLGLSGKLGASNVAPDQLPDGFTMAAGVPTGESAGTSDQQLKASQVEEQRKMILEQACTQEALARLRRIGMVREEKAKAIESSIISMALAGKLPGKINEGKMIEILERGNAKPNAGSSQEGQISIQRKRYAFDSDEESGDDEL
jgi:programmed cell death protein 5